MGRQGFSAAGGRPGAGSGAAAGGPAAGSLVLGGAARRFLLLAVMLVAAAYFATAPFFYTGVQRAAGGRPGAGSGAAAGGPAAGSLVLGGAARRFLLLAVMLVAAAYFATAPFFYDSPAVDVIAGWIAIAGGGILAAAGTTVAVSGAIIRTDHGGFVVTQECIFTLLIPLYIAGTLAAPLGRWPRAAALLATPLIFFCLGVSRLLVLSVPAAVVGLELQEMPDYAELRIARRPDSGQLHPDVRLAARQPGRRSTGHPVGPAGGQSV